MFGQERARELSNTYKERPLSVLFVLHSDYSFFFLYCIYLICLLVSERHDVERLCWKRNVKDIQQFKNVFIDWILNDYVQILLPLWHFIWHESKSLRAPRCRGSFMLAQFWYLNIPFSDFSPIWNNKKCILIGPLVLLKWFICQCLLTSILSQDYRLLNSWWPMCQEAAALYFFFILKFSPKNQHQLQVSDYL